MWSFQNLCSRKPTPSDLLAASDWGPDFSESHRMCVMVWVCTSVTDFMWFWNREKVKQLLENKCFPLICVSGSKVSSYQLTDWFLSNWLVDFGIRIISSLWHIFFFLPPRLVSCGLTMCPQEITTFSACASRVRPWIQQDLVPKESSLRRAPLGVDVWSWCNWLGREPRLTKWGWRCLLPMGAEEKGSSWKWAQDLGRLFY